MAVMEQGIWYPDKVASDLVTEDQFDLPVAAEAGRYHLYMSYACPFAHRPYLVIRYLGLDDAISVSSVAAERFESGWRFDTEHPDPLDDVSTLAERYLQAKPTYSGSVTVPVLWDKQAQTIRGNDSSALAVMLAKDWLPLAKHPAELVPAQLREKIEAMNLWLHQNVNRKVYHVGFATDQQAYDAASDTLFSALAQLDRRLGEHRYLHGDQITLSDLFLLPTLVRFEAVYALHFKANKQSLSAFTRLYRYMLDLISMERIGQTIDIEYMKQHYYVSHRPLNPHGIVPAGPALNW
ncbi:glutathione S-transferase C-terminal domain-containing protein [Photobacterium atrarenae]|uniref:Glutathione S-transferase C-terminal domain-containing protein n=1 Tax=Photobacterium atrarenae TaxID=865757 RepID=A0ABY5GMI6_9GAMM|nr:glutathione S-transferase C-terminal domain-containing protein [Photobacterium atrarenae]UTV30548.1 glutathione S-transferase C-terminal domain-containing protein [Photobacterium atrarenae]